MKEPELIRTFSYDEYGDIYKIVQEIANKHGATIAPMLAYEVDKDYYEFPDVTTYEPEHLDEMIKAVNEFITNL